MYDLYVATGTEEIDMIKLDQIESTADKNKLKEYYGVSAFKARIKLHQDLISYLEERKAEKRYNKRITVQSAQR